MYSLDVELTPQEKQLCTWEKLRGKSINLQKEMDNQNLNILLQTLSLQICDLSFCALTSFSFNFLK